MLIPTAKFAHPFTEFTPSQEVWVVGWYNIADSGIKPSLLKCFGWISPALPTKQLSERPPAEHTHPSQADHPKSRMSQQKWGFFWLRVLVENRKAGRQLWRLARAQRGTERIQM